MQIAAPEQRQLILFGESQRLPQAHAVGRQPLAMQSGVCVARLHRLRQREQNGLRLVERIDQRLVAQHGADPRAHHRRLQRPHQEFIRPRVDPGNLVLHTLDAGGHQNRNQLGPSVGL